MGEWIEWGGGECPNLPKDTLVAVRFRDGEVIESMTVNYWYRLLPFANNWLHGSEDPESEIVAYKVLK